MPVFQHHGTALVGAHSKEVSGVAWTTEGNLVTVSDDYTARCWYEAPMRMDSSTPPSSSSSSTPYSALPTSPSRQRQQQPAAGAMMSARYLRRLDRTDGRRWGCGWADVGDSYDNDDDDDDDNNDES